MFRKSVVKIPHAYKLQYETTRYQFRDAKLLLTLSYLILLFRLHKLKMPQIKIQHVVSCSSEDATHKASNLLNSESFRKWKCATAGEKQASVILQLEKSSVIHSIDIGNESSAFVEVLVGHSTSDNPDDYQVILVTSSFMNPIESKNGSNANRVRMFGPDKLCKTVLGKRWDRLKIVCTQPFNKHITYGLSFIKLHSPPEETDSTSPTSQKMLGKFTLKEESPAPLIKAGSFFKDRNQPKEDPVPLKGAAAIRAASYQTPSEKESSSPRKKQTTLDFKPKASPTEPSSSSSTASSSRRSPEPKQPKKRKLTEEESRESSSSHKPTEQAKRKHLEKPKESSSRRFDEIMKGVTFVLSGYQNPYRGEIRDKGLKMGAKYEASWGPGCTHLICAFVNTPKYQQVHGKGKIVGKEWILDSYRKKCLQPWKRYKLSKGDESSSSEDDSEAEELPPPAKEKKSSTPERQEKRTPEPKLREEKNDEKGKQDPPCPDEKKEEEEEEKEDEYVGSTDVESIGDGDKTKDALDSDADTEDELNQLKSGQQKEDPFAGSTDEEEDADDVKNKPITKDDVNWEDIPQLPDFFNEKHFLFYGKFPSDTRRQLHRFVIAFGGKEENYMSDKVDFVVTESNWDKSFDEALKENKSLVFVKPRWLNACNQKGKLVSHESYVIERE